MRFVIVALTVGVAVLTTACNRNTEKAEAPPPAVAEAPPAPAPGDEGPAVEVAPGYRHEAAFDASGFYLTPRPVQIGSYRLTHLGIGAPSDFQQWEKGERASVFGPILLQFDDVSSPVRTNEMGGEAYTVSVRVLPQAYSLTTGEVTFRGADPKLGEVLFSGQFDQPALAEARNEGSSQDPVLRGLLKVGEAPAKPVAMVYFVGE
ncbi:MAG: hypothetical protein Q8J89_16235 [Caulobacter sp.]|nr:hypothetical protein [Caulobacter sp.]